MKKFFTLLFLLFTASWCNADYFQNILLTSVAIHVKLKGDDFKWHQVGCSGTFIDDNHVLTAAHCFESPEFNVWVKDYNGKSYEAFLVKIDTQKDLALLKIHIKKHKHTRIGPNGQLGQNVFIVGSPYGLDFLLSEGLISKLNNTLEPFTGGYTIHTGMINPGSSGGGLFDTKGRLIGVNTLSIGGMFGWAGISAAVDANTIRGFLK